MSTVGSEAARAPISYQAAVLGASSRYGSTSDAGRDPRIYEVVAPFTVQPEEQITYLRRVAVGISRRLSEPESWNSMELINVPSPSAPYRFLHDALGDDWQLLVLVLAQGAQPV